jgi:hypothetical protein
LYLELDECCYSYASVPHNDSFCVPNGEQVDLDCLIINPHDNFTNLTVTWFRSTTEDTSIFDEIPATSEEYRYYFNTMNLSSVINCSRKVYRDAFALIINNFTRHKNGYYWCQLSINSTSVQPSYSAQFLAGECGITNYYRLAILSQRKCAQYVGTESDAGLTTYESPETSPVASSRESSTRSSSVAQQERESDETIIYVASSLSTLVLVFGAMIIVLSILYLCKFQNRERSKSHAIIYACLSHT